VAVASEPVPPRACVLLWGEAAEPVVRAIEVGGGEVVAHAGRWAELLVVALEHDAEVVVLDLAMSGRAGVRLVSALRELVPDTRIVVVSELRAIDIASLEAGADVVVAVDDLRPLSAAVRGTPGAPVQLRAGTDDRS
jgi:DNA-binding NarL/FixJ family response regulator